MSILTAWTGAAFAQNLVRNPSFELVESGSAGGIASNSIPVHWTQSGDPGCAFESLTDGQSPVNGEDFQIGASGSDQAYLPTSGSHVLISDEGPEDVSCKIYQDVTIPTWATSATLTVAAGAVFRYNDSPTASTVILQVTTPGGTPIATLYSRASSAGANDPLVDRAPVDLGAYIGQSVRIIGTASVVDSDWAGLQVDDVRLSVTGTPPPVRTPNPVPASGIWALMLGALMILASGGAALLRRKRKR